MATTKKRKKSMGGQGARKSIAHRVLYSAGAVAAGAVVGAVAGRASLAVGVAGLIAGAMQNNPLMTIAGAAACVVPGQLSSAEKSTAGGLKGQFEDARSSLKIMAANTLQKTAVDKFFPNAFPSLGLGGMDDTSYYGSGTQAAEIAFNNAMRGIGAGDDEVSGYDDDMDMGRVAEAGYQAMEIDGSVGSLGTFQDVAAAASQAW